MSYEDNIGSFKFPNDEQTKLLSDRRKLTTPESDYENVRFGMPTKPLVFEKVKDEMDLLRRHFLSCGYSTFPSSKLTDNVKKHVALFRCQLDLWEALCGQGSMCKDEIYYRCITEGPSFTAWVKKARSDSMRFYTSETNTAVEEEYILPNYKGYNSLIHEGYLIHWDDSAETDDVKYAFIEANKIDEHKFRRRVRTLFEDFRIKDVEFNTEMDMIKGLKNSVMYDPIKKESILMREFWTEDLDTSGPYFAKRRVVPIASGNTRDTGVGDPSTILKVKQLNMLARVISEKLPYCANAPEQICNGRLKRVLKRNAFLHLDFKKFGLTFPRSLMNIMIEEIGVVSGIDTSHLIIDGFFIEIDDETYETERGTVLGWLDCINCLCVTAILHSLSKDEELKFDFITFNDDVEISKYAKSDIKNTLELLRMAVVSELNSYDIAISLDKTYGSLGSVFLERYAYFDRHYGLDMYKEQLTVKAFAKSCVATYPWQAKLFHSAAEQWTKNEYATDRCIRTCPVEFRSEEIPCSLWSGGWFIYRKNNLDLSIVECDRLGYLLGVKISRYKSPNLTTPTKSVSSSDKRYKCIEKQCMDSYTSGIARLAFDDMKTLSEINNDMDLIREILETSVFLYDGRDVNFAHCVSRLVNDNLERLKKS